MFLGVGFHDQAHRGYRDPFINYRHTVENLKLAHLAHKPVRSRTDALVYLVAKLRKVAVYAILEVDPQGRGADVEILVKSHPHGFENFLNVYCHFLYPVHGFEQCFVLDLDLKAHLFADFVQLGLDILKVRGTVLEIDHHDHYEIAPHHFLGDILDIDIVLVQHVADLRDNAFPVAPHHSDKGQLLARIFLVDRAGLYFVHDYSPSILFKFIVFVVPKNTE